MLPVRRLLGTVLSIAALAVDPTLLASDGFRYVCQDAGAGGYESFPDICRLRDGRLLCVFYAGYDHGKSWTSPVKIDNAGLRLDAETDIIELRDGRLWAAQRGASGVQLHGSFSSDRGQTWSASTPAGFEGHCPYLLRTAEGSVLLAVREFDNGPIKGATTLRISRDDCRT